MSIQLANPAANHSFGTQINRTLDALGYPDSFGDALGALADLRTGNLAGAFRNLVDLNSGLSTRSMDAISGGGPRAGFARAFAPRCGCNGPHLARYRGTYAVREQVGQRAHVGQRFDYSWGPFRLTGRISGAEYAGSFAKPIRLENGSYLYRGRTYADLQSIVRDARDGRIDGQATRYRTGARQAWRPGMPALRPFPFPAPFGPFGPGFGAGLGVSNSVLDLIGKIFGGAAGGTGSSGGSGSSGSTGSTGGAGSTGGTGDTGSILSDPNLTLEDKLALLMAKLSKHLDEQIEEKMKSIENAMQQKKSGESGKSGGGLLGKIGSFVGGAFGGLLGSQGSSGAGGGSNGENGSNLQLLQTQLQQLLQKRSEMFQTMSNILKSLHDTSMNTIRQLKA